MLSQDNRFRVNDRECAAKVIDGEAVIINLFNGTYYGLDKCGSLAWEMLAGGYSIAETVGGMIARYNVTPETARADIARLLQELLQEKLLVAAVADAAAGTVADGSLVLGTRTSNDEYETPALTTYRDMADLLALDPPMPRLEDIVWSENTASAIGNNQ